MAEQVEPVAPMQYIVKGVPFTVVAKEALSTSDPDHLGWINFATCEIELLKSIPLAMAFRTLAHEVAHAWMGNENPPETEEQFCIIAAPLLVTFYEETIRLGGVPALAAVMGVPCETDVAKSLNPNFVRDVEKNRDYAVIRWVICWELDDEMYASFAARCEAFNLNPLRGDCFPRISWDPKAKMRRVEIGTTIKAMRKIARRTGQLAHIGQPMWADEDLVWKEGWAPTDRPPVFAKVEVTRKDHDKPFVGVARYDSFVQLVLIGDREVVDRFWRKMPDHMLAKCAENIALIKAFEECDGLFVGEMLRPEFEGRATPAGRRVPNPELNMISAQIIDSQIQQLKARQAESASAIVMDDERPAPRGAMAELHRHMIESGVHVESVREAIIDQVKAKHPMLEDENPELFASMVMDEVRRRRRR